MQNKIVLGALFLGMLLLQWYVPTSMIFGQEDILQNGVMYKFECEPIDPTDPFRGKYITLGFREDEYFMQEQTYIERGDKIYVSLKRDSFGFAKIESIYAKPPSDMRNIVEAEAGWRFNRKEADSYRVNVNYPFDRFYMEESKAKPAEDLVRSATRDSLLSVYAIVMIKDGSAVLKDVMVDDKPIREMIKNAE